MIARHSPCHRAKNSACGSTISSVNCIPNQPTHDGVGKRVGHCMGGKRTHQQKGNDGGFDLQFFLLVCTRRKTPGAIESMTELFGEV